MTKKSSKRNFIPEFRFRFLSFEDFQNLGCFMINTVLPALLQCISEVVRYIATHRSSILGQTFEVRNRLTIQFVFTTLFLCSKINKVAIYYCFRSFILLIYLQISYKLYSINYNQIDKVLTLSAIILTCAILSMTCIMIKLTITNYTSLSS